MKTVSYKSPRVLQSLLIAIGGILIVFAFLADLLGYGDAGNFGIGQLFLVMAGGHKNIHAVEKVDGCNRTTEPEK